MVINTHIPVACAGLSSVVATTTPALVCISPALLMVTCMLALVSFTRYVVSDNDTMGTACGKTEIHPVTYHIWCVEALGGAQLLL